MDEQDQRGLHRQQDLSGRSKIKGEIHRIGAFKKYIVVRSSEATFADAFDKQEAIFVFRYLGGFDSTGEVGFEETLEP
ncbi:hypothetical protein DVH24_015289 [Malus domestica]|uniref:Uncharacterized protein n=1 Tax=Malus domestica TaxID=3750 RepID=A0A498K1A0_MALDO|nr:hypothetical protein DVH24_015289 [Malus domestica]